MVDDALPDGWKWETIENLSENVVDCLHSTPKFIPSEGKYCIDTTCIEPGKILFDLARLVSEETFNERIRRLKPRGGDIFFSREGTIGTAVIVPENVEVCLGQRMMMFRPSSAVTSKFFLWGLLSDFFVNQWKPKIIGTTSPHINIGDIRQMVLPVPPLPEQERIVAKIDELFTQLDAGKSALAKVQAGLRRYKASVLKAAFEGKLLESRKTDNNDLPEGWQWKAIKDLASGEWGSIQSGPFGSHLLHSEFQDEGILAIGIDNVLDGSFSLGRQHRISPEKYNQLKKFTARPLDVLITVMATVGRCCVLPENIETSIITKHVYRITGDKSIIDPYYLMYSLSGGQEVRNQLFGEIRGQTRPGINGTILKELLIPLPPLEEQRQIVAEVERRLSVARQVQSSVEEALMRAARLRQAVLKSAFEGRL
jgi:restriction endonuclease S subunit